MPKFIQAFYICIVSVLLLAGASACQASPEEQALTASPTPVAESPTTPPTENPTVEEAAVTEDTVDECLECHRDQQLLIDTADPEEEVISENEGAG
jgi:hypothetical protein